MIEEFAEGVHHAAALGARTERIKSGTNEARN